jgi:hypothetical protein
MRFERVLRGTFEPTRDERTQEWGTFLKRRFIFFYYS